MRIQFLTNGNLEMFCSDKKEQTRIKRQFGEQMGTIQSEEEFIREYLEPLGYKQIQPVECGALTSAILITKIAGNETGDVWGGMDYQIKSFIETLANGDVVIWTKG